MFGYSSDPFLECNSDLSSEADSTESYEEQEPICSICKKNYMFYCDECIQYTCNTCNKDRSCKRKISYLNINYRLALRKRR